MRVEIILRIWRFLLTKRDFFVILKMDKWGTVNPISRSYRSGPLPYAVPGAPSARSGP